MRVDLTKLRGADHAAITSVCSAHPVVLHAALRHARQTNSTVLIEATCNQVNHQGGYTGMQPADFATLVHQIAAKEGCPRDLILLGGDHLGPNPWRDLPADEALKEAEVMMAAYVRAGFRKLHLDASMGCAGEPAALSDEVTAHRAARLAAVAEQVAAGEGLTAPLYIIGTEVPPPGGADHVLDTVEPTAVDAAAKTIAVHREVFARAGLSEAFERAIGLVVQPGVEFGNHNVVTYDPTRARALVSLLHDEPQFVYEAHSTDYQGLEPLSALVRDGFQILKVGPELTFVLREALYALDLIASELLEDYNGRLLRDAMERAMCDDPKYWARHYSGTSKQQAVLRHYSLSDRIRYYWPVASVQLAVDYLCDSLRDCKIPSPLMRQHFPAALDFADRPLSPEDLLIWAVMRPIISYHAAVSH